MGYSPWGCKESDMTAQVKEELHQNGPDRDWIPCAGAVLSLAQRHRGRPQTTSTRLYAGGDRWKPTRLPRPWDSPGKNTGGRGP